MLIPAILVTIAAALLSIEQNNGQFGFARPLVAGTVIGIVLGDPAMGVILGAEMQSINSLTHDDRQMRAEAQAAADALDLDNLFV